MTTSAPYFLNTIALTIPNWRTFELLRWIQNLDHSTWDHELLYVDRSSGYEQLSAYVGEKLKNVDVDGG
jgi:hypothetical protein